MAGVPDAPRARHCAIEIDPSAPPGRERAPAANQGPDVSVTTSTSPSVAPTSPIVPSRRHVYAVRWVREDQATRQKLYLHRMAAFKFADRLRDSGYDPVIYVSRVDWQET